VGTGFSDKIIAELKTLGVYDDGKAAKMIKIEQTGSAIRRLTRRRDVIGLKAQQDRRTTELQDTPAIRGMIAKVSTSCPHRRREIDGA